MFFMEGDWHASCSQSTQQIYVHQRRADHHLQFLHWTQVAAYSHSTVDNSKIQSLYTRIRTRWWTEQNKNQTHHEEINKLTAFHSSWILPLLLCGLGYAHCTFVLGIDVVRNVAVRIRWSMHISKQLLFPWPLCGMCRTMVSGTANTEASNCCMHQNAMTHPAELLAMSYNEIPIEIGAVSNAPWSRTKRNETLAWLKYSSIILGIFIVSSSTYNFTACLLLPQQTSIALCAMCLNLGIF